MSCLGVHFALTADDVALLRAAEGHENRVIHVQEVIEERYGCKPPYAAESDKSWDAMHRALADGHLTWDGGTYPLSHTVLGGEVLSEEDDYLISLKSLAEVRDIAAALAQVKIDDFRKRYDAIDATEYQRDLDDEDFLYTWEWLQNVRRLYAVAAAEGRFVLFTADQ
jgi:hypothetical protein